MVSAECLRPRNPPIRPRGALRTAYATTGLSNARLLSRWACWARTLGMEASLLQYRITTTGSPRLTAHRAASQDPDRNSKGGNTTSPVNRGSLPSRACARRSRPGPRLEGGLTYRRAWIGRQHSLSDTAIRKRAKANGWTRDLSGAVRSHVRESSKVWLAGRFARTCSPE